MNSFYVLKPEDGLNLGVTWAYAIREYPLVTGEAQKCPICGKPVSSPQWLAPHHIKVSKYKPDKWGDFLWTKDSDLLVSRKFKEMVDQEGLTGIFKFSGPVETISVGKYQPGQFPYAPAEYYLVQVLWGGANQDDFESGVTYQRPKELKCKFCRNGKVGRKQDRIIIESGSWRGKDIFTARNSPAPYLVSERFKQAAQAHLLTNAWFIPAEKFGYDESRWGKWYVTDSDLISDDQDVVEVASIENEPA